jgi:hypothetical protein
MAIPISSNTSADALRDVFWDRASLAAKPPSMLKTQ